MTAPNTVGYSAGAVCCPDIESAMTHWRAGACATWFNTGEDEFDLGNGIAGRFDHVGQLTARASEYQRGRR